MAACGSIQQIFDAPPPPPHPDDPTLPPWKPIQRPIRPRSSFTEIFGELHFQEQVRYDPPSSSAASFSPPPPPSSMAGPPSSSPSLDLIPEPKIDNLRISGGGEDDGREVRDDLAGDDFGHTRRRSSHSSDSFSSFRSQSPTMTTESLHLCTEGLGFESFDDMEYVTEDDGLKASQEGAEANPSRLHSPWLGQSQNLSREFRRSKSFGGAFPPPISSIGKTGKPWVSFRSFRQDGRFVLKEIRVPTREFLHASRENGRLKLQIVQPEDGIVEGEEDEEDKTAAEEDENGIGNGDAANRSH